MSERRAELQAVFAKHSKDNSGDVDTKELRHIFLALGVEKTAEQIDKLLVNNSGTLSFVQFESLFCSSRLEDSFHKYDTDGSGNIFVD
jgi:Ca2+-binding EF-hand superfamily protein